MLEKDFGTETEDIPFSDIPGFTGDAEADEEFRRQQEVQDDQQQQPSTEEEETTEEETPDTEDEKEALLAKTFRKRPSGFGNLSGKGEWDRKYEGKVNPTTGKVIIAPRRPADGGEKTKEIEITTGAFESLQFGTGKMKKVTEAEYWDATYGETHDPISGLPLDYEKLLED